MTAAESGLLRRSPKEEMQRVRLGVPPLQHVSPSGILPQDLMEVTAGEPVREECLKGLLNGKVAFVLVRSQVSCGDERIESCVGRANHR
jgi:hypothetical protein